MLTEREAITSMNLMLNCAPDKADLVDRLRLVGMAASKLFAQVDRAKRDAFIVRWIEVLAMAITMYELAYENNSSEMVN